VADSSDPAQNIQGGARYQRDLMRMFDNQLHLVIAAYNAGEQAVIRHGNRVPPYREKLAHVPKVLKFYKQYNVAHAAQPDPDDRSGPAALPRSGSRVFRTYLPRPS